MGRSVLVHDYFILFIMVSILELPTLFTKNSESRTEISSDFDIGFSIRTSGYAELFFCEGWNRTSYPCYYIKLGDTELRQTYLQKYNHFQELQNHYKLAEYKVR